MCRSCYNIRCQLKRLHKLVALMNAKHGEEWPLAGQLTDLELEYKISIAKAESAQVLGRMYEGFLQNATTLECEDEFLILSKGFVKKELFSHCAFLFEKFSPVHRRYLMYLIGKIMQEFYSRNRRKMAYGNVALKSRKEVLADRAWGTYRVEDDVEAATEREAKD